MKVLELDKLRIEIEIIRQIVNFDKDDRLFIRKKELQKFLEDKQLMYNRLQKVYAQING